MLILKILVCLLGAVFAAALLFLLLSAVCALTVNPGRFYTRHNAFFRWLLDILTACVLFLLRVHVRIEGEDLLPDSRFVLVSNHVSNFDPIVTWYALRNHQLAFISKPENFHVPIFGRIIRRCGFLSIDRENPRRAVTTIHQAIQLIRDDQVSMGVYPEGTRSKTGELLPFHNAVFKIAQQAGVPLVIAVVKGTRGIVPFRGTEVVLKLVRVIPAADITGVSTARIGEAVRTCIAENR